MKSAFYIKRLLRTGRRICQRRYEAESDDKILIKEGWVTRGAQTKKIRYHSRMRFGLSYNKKCNMYIILRYISPLDDEVFLKRLEVTLDNLQIPKNKLNVVMKRGRRSLVNMVAKGVRTTRKILKAKATYLVRNFKEYQPIPIKRVSKLKSNRW